MSQILDRLKQAEQERERVIAERKRLEAEADAALAAHDREQIVQQQEPRAAPPPPPPIQPRAQTPQQQSRMAATVAIAVAMAVVFWVGTLMPRKPMQEPAVRSEERAARIVAPLAPEPAAPARQAAPALFKLDTDVDAFAARAKGKE